MQIKTLIKLNHLFDDIQYIYPIKKDDDNDLDSLKVQRTWFEKKIDEVYGLNYIDAVNRSRYGS